MSSMLDQAVIDATALKDAALKNAEQLVLEKYAPQIKQAINSLLEQDDEELDPMDPMGDQLPMDQMGGDESPTEDPLVKDLSLAATDGESACACPDEDEEIEINFDELAQMSSVDDTSSQLPGQMGAVPETEEELFMEEDMSGVLVPAHLGPDLHMYHMSMSDPVYKVGSMAYSGKKVPTNLLENAITNLENISGKIQDSDDAQHIQELITELQDILSSVSDSGESVETNQEMSQDSNMLEAVEPDSLEEDKSCDEEFNIRETLKNEFDLSENDIIELEESLEVDLNVVPHGHPGHATTSERIEAEQMQLAKLQDTAVAEEMNKFNKAFEKLQKENQSFKKQLKSLAHENKSVKNVALIAIKKLNELNVHNAQLVYKNRTLESVSLNERQKKQIVEAISKVDSVKEAKIVFETLNKSLMTKEDVKPLPKSLNEAIQKTNGMFLRSNETSESISPQKERMQRLAGILKNS